MISLIIPATTSNQHYTNNLVRNIRDLYPNEDEVEIIVEINDNVSLGINLSLVKQIFYSICYELFSCYIIITNIVNYAFSFIYLPAYLIICNFT